MEGEFFYLFLGKEGAIDNVRVMDIKIIELYYKKIH